MLDFVTVSEQRRSGKSLNIPHVENIEMFPFGAHASVNDA